MHHNSNELQRSIALLYDTLITYAQKNKKRYSSQSEAVPQSFLSLRISSVNEEPQAPMRTLDIAHIVLSNIASTFESLETMSV
uniref:Uncharacterized protein n=1 Tax=Noccaea caerulescens TaxID=107243 RepID=A0A1J3JFX7_NOCCA